jgi:hypothetical protein
MNMVELQLEMYNLKRKVNGNVETKWSLHLASIFIEEKQKFITRVRGQF